MDTRTPRTCLSTAGENYNINELWGISSHNAGNNVLTVSNFSDIMSIRARLVTTVCDGENKGFHIGWAASDFLTRASKFCRAGVKVNMTPNGERQIVGPDRSQFFVAASPM